MGSSVAYPIFRTQSVAEAVQVAFTLVQCSGPEGDGSVYVDAELARVDDVLKAYELFPDATYSSGNSFFHGGELPGNASVLKHLLPVRLSADQEECPAEGVLGTMVSLLEEAVSGQLAWMGVAWPAVPELCLGREVARTGVQACFNSTAEHEPAVGHTVYVHVRPGEDERAHHLAQQVRQAVIGPPEDGW